MDRAVYHLAQLNVARLKTAYDDPSMKDFIDNLDPVNATADASPGFVWRLVSDDAAEQALTDFEASGWLVNMSVWESVEALRAFIASPLHLSIMRRRAEWFRKSEQATMVLWWVRQGHRPSFAEALERLEFLRANGPGGFAFSFSDIHVPPRAG